MPGAFQREFRCGTVWVSDAKVRCVSRLRESGEVLDFVEKGPLSAYSVAISGTLHDPNPDEVATLFSVNLMGTFW
jgi:hypothetical protein